MKFILIASIKGVWTNASSRQLLGVKVGDQVTITADGGRSVCAKISMAPKERLKLLKSLEREHVAPAIAVSPAIIHDLGIETVQEVEVVAGSPKESKVTEPSQDVAKKLTNKERLATLDVGDVETFSAAFVNSGMYSAAKDLGIKVRKVSDTKLERIR